MRIYIVIILTAILSGCSINRKQKDAPHDGLLFYSVSFQDSLECFLNSVNSFPSPDNAISPEFCVTFGKFGSDTLMTLSADINIASSKELNALSQTQRMINNYYYSQEGALCMSNKPVLVRTLDTLDISGIINRSCLNRSLGNEIDSVTVKQFAESWHTLTYKLYKISSPDSLILLHDYYLGEERMKIKGYDRYLQL